MKRVDLNQVAAVVTAADYKRAVHIMQSDTDDDVLIQMYIDVATDVVETAIARFLTPRQMEFEAPEGDWGCWWFPVAPVQSLISVDSWDGADWVAEDLGDFTLRSGNDEPRLILQDSYRWQGPVGPLRVRAICGYEDGYAPKQPHQSIILMVKEWFEAGIAVEDLAEVKMNWGVSALIQQVRYRRPCEVL
ncbi:MAG: hypothetical protein ABJO27_14100 [Pseudoruegeria sp.]